MRSRATAGRMPASPVPASTLEAWSADTLATLLAHDPELVIKALDIAMDRLKEEPRRDA